MQVFRQEKKKSKFKQVGLQLIIVFIIDVPTVVNYLDSEMSTDSEKCVLQSKTFSIYTLYKTEKSSKSFH